MAELTDYDIQRIKSMMSSFSAKVSTLNRIIERSYFDSEISSAQSNIDRYLRDASDAKAKASSCIKTALDGSGFFFRTNGLNDVINEKTKTLTEEANKMISSYDKEITSIIGGIGTLDHVSATGAMFDASEYDEEHQYAFYTEDNKLVKQTDSSSVVSNDVVEQPFVNTQELGTSGVAHATGVPIVTMDNNTCSDALSKRNDAVKGETFIDSLSSVFDEEELSAKKQTVKKEETHSKRVVITKKTHLDNDEIKGIFLSRHIDCNLSIEQLNKAIIAVGNDTDKDAILLEALKIRFMDYIPSFDYFYCYTSISKAINLAIKIGKFDDAFDMLCGLIFLETSGYLMAHSKWKERRNIDETEIDPRITSKLFEVLQEQTPKIDDEITTLFSQSQYVNSLYDSMPAPLYSIKNSSKLMVKVYHEPYAFLKCENLNIPYNR